MTNGRGDGLSLARGAWGSPAVGQEGSAGEPSPVVGPVRLPRGGQHTTGARGAGGGGSAERAAVGAEKHLDPRRVCRDTRAARGHAG